MQRGTFRFLRSYYEAAKQLAAVSPEEALSYLMAIMEYGFDDIAPDVGGIAGAMFTLVKPNIEKTVKMSDGGAKGGSRPKGYGKPNESLPEGCCKGTQSPSQQEEGSRKKEVGSRNNTPHTPRRGTEAREKEQQFEEFWSKYPKKVAKSTAKKAFEKVSAPLETLLAAIERQECSVQWSKDGGQYIPNPATWLNQERWNDELEPPAKHPGCGERELDADELATIRRYAAELEEK